MNNAKPLCRCCQLVEYEWWSVESSVIVEIESNQAMLRADTGQPSYHLLYERVEAKGRLVYVGPNVCYR